MHKTFEWHVSASADRLSIDNGTIKINPAKEPICKIHNHEIGLRFSILEGPMMGGLPFKIIATVCCEQQLVENGMHSDDC